MITITYKDKTYSTQKFHLYQDDYIHSTIMIWKAYGWLEEVKENKEPQPQEDIELLPEYQLRTQDNGRHRMTPSHEEKQIILLTNAVNQLIKSNKNPL